MAAGEHIAIAVRPSRGRRVVIEHFGPQLIGHGRKCHRRAGMAATGGFDAVHREGTDRVDGQLRKVVSSFQHVFYDRKRW